MSATGFRLKGADGVNPIVVHQSPPAIKFDLLQNTGGWFIVCKIEDEAAAIARLKFALRDPAYRLFWHNCQHLANFVAFGVRESKQLQKAGWVAGLAIMAIVAFTDDET
jgi:hypothetical protein